MEELIDKKKALKEYESMLLMGSYYWLSKEQLEDKINKLKAEISKSE